MLILRRVKPISFEKFRDSLQPVGAAAVVDPKIRASVQDTAEALAGLRVVSRTSLAQLVQQHPDWVPHLATVCRLSQEKLKSALKHGLQTDAWRTLAKERPGDLVELLDERFHLVEEIKGQRRRKWTFADVLVERLGSRTNAAGTVGIGRLLENQVEEVVKALGIPYQMRTSFVARSGRPSPADVAIPGGGSKAEIIIGIKSFGSTGSKQTDAARELEELADNRAAHQYVYAFTDGIGWIRRESDLRRVIQLWRERKLDGVFNLSMLADFKAELEDAARRAKLLPSK